VNSVLDLVKIEHVRSSNNKNNNNTNKIVHAPEHSTVVPEKLTVLHTINKTPPFRDSENSYLCFLVLS
jgi:hypothetical protein